MNERIFADTSALYALFDVKASEHRKVKDFIGRFKGGLVVTNYIFSEIVTLVRRRAGHEKAVLIGSTLLKSPQIEKIWVTPKDEKDAWELFISREDKAYSFTDCTSFVMMRRIRVGKHLSLDEHFRQEGFEGVL